MTTIVPAAVLLVLQWANWWYIAETNSDYTTYFTNAITLVLALVVVIPQMRDDSYATRNKISSIDGMIFFFFLGTVLSAFPNSTASLIGLLITTGSLIFPAFGIARYFAKVRSIRHPQFKVPDLLPLTEHTSGEVLDFAKVKIRQHEEFAVCLSRNIDKFRQHGWEPFHLESSRSNEMRHSMFRFFGSKNSQFPALEQNIPDTPLGIMNEEGDVSFIGVAHPNCPGSTIHGPFISAENQGYSLICSKCETRLMKDVLTVSQMSFTKPVSTEENYPTLVHRLNNATH
jgi:hypothetical protein